MTAVPILSAANYQEIFRTLGQNRGKVSKQLLQKKGTFTYPAGLQNMECDLCLLKLLSLDACPKGLARQKFSLQKAYFTGMKRSFVFNTTLTGKDAHLRHFLIHLYSIFISAGVRAKDFDSFFAELGKKEPELMKLAAKSLSKKEQNLITEMHDTSSKPFDLCSLENTPYFTQGLELGRKANAHFLNELKGEPVATASKGKIITELFEFLATHRSPSSKPQPTKSAVVQFCAGFYLAHAELGTTYYHADHELREGYDELRDTVANLIEAIHGQFYFEYQGYYREVEIQKTEQGRRISISE